MAERRTYSREFLEAHPAWSIEPPTPELVAKAEEAGWSRQLLDRALALRRDRGEIEQWIVQGFPTAEMIEQWVPSQEQILNSTLTVRTATWQDGELLADLCANAAEAVGDWSVTVERGPNPFAQYRLQEHPNVNVIEDRRVGLGMAAYSVRNTLIEGERTTALFMSGWRIRDGFRGMGLSRVLQDAGGPGTGWFGLVTYYYVRGGNASTTWISKVQEGLSERPEGFEQETEALTSTVTYFPEPGLGRRSARVRPATPADLEVCLALINRTHAGLDLFRPYSEDFLSTRLDDPSWGPKPPFYPSIYGWPDYRVLEVDGTVVACGGLWDRGRDVREVWRREDEQFVVDPTALMDFGFAEGADAEMAELVAHLLAETADLGRSGLLAALEYTPGVAAGCAGLAPRTESRELFTSVFATPGLELDLTIRRPYLDLAYW